MGSGGRGSGSGGGDGGGGAEAPAGESGMLTFLDIAVGGGLGRGAPGRGRLGRHLEKANSPSISSLAALAAVYWCNGVAEWAIVGFC